MTPRRSMVGNLAHTRLFGRPWPRRAFFAIVVAICAVFSVYPQYYRAAVSLTPTDPANLGLSGTLGELGAVNTVFGNQTAVEVSLKIARSVYVREQVAKELKLEERLDLDQTGVARWLDRHVDARTLRGGILQFEMRDRDPEFARNLVATYAEAVRRELAVVSRNQTAYKREILEKLVQEAMVDYTAAQAKFDSYRLTTAQGDPSVSIGETAKRVPVLQAAIKAKEIELNAARQYATDQNLVVGKIKAEISALQSQLAAARSSSPASPFSVGEVVRQSTEYLRLERDLETTRNLYENYRRYLLGTSVEDLTATANIRILEPAYVDPSIQFNYIPLALGMIFLLIGLLIEFYTLRPPVGHQPVTA